MTCSPWRRKITCFLFLVLCSNSNIFQARNFRFLSWKLSNKIYKQFHEKDGLYKGSFTYYLLVMKMFVSCPVTLRNRDIGVMICHVMFSINSFLLFLFKLIWFVPGCQVCFFLMLMREKETYMLIRMDEYLCQDEMAW